MMRAFLSFSLAMLFASASAVPGQSTSVPKEVAGLSAQEAGTVLPPALASLQARYAESIAAADHSVTGQWAASLAVLEKSRAAAEDYAGADRVRHRREEALAVAGADDGRIPIRLKAQDAAKKGSGLKEDDKSGIITIISSGAFIEWDISGEIKGWYEVKLTHAVAGRKDRTGEISPTAGTATLDRRPKKNGTEEAGTRSGLLSFQNVTNLKSSESLVLRREIVSTGGPYEWATASMGLMEISGRIAKCKLVYDEAGSEPVRLLALELIPVPQPSAVGDGTVRLVKVREVFDKEFRNLTQASNNRYRETLTQLEQQAQHTNDTDTLVRLRDEKARLLNTPSQLALGEAGESRTGGAPLVLDAVTSINCFCHGDISPDKARKCLTKLRPAGSATVTWRLPAYHIGSGTYTVEVKGRVQLNGGGTASLAALAKGGTPAGSPLKVEVKPVVSPEAKGKKPDPKVESPVAENRTLEPGSIVIGKGAESLVLTVTGLTHSEGSLMDLSQITLTRTGDVPPPAKKP
jgi:hypothetical protein